MENLKRLLCVVACLITIPVSVNGNNCTEEEFKCSDGTCIPLVQICDNDLNCASGEDEVNCSPNSCPEGLIRCFDECKYECETTTDTLTTIEITTTNEQQTNTNAVTTTSETQTTIKNNHVTTSTVTLSTTTAPGDNQIISTTPVVDKSNTNNLYWLFLLFFIPILVVAVVLKVIYKKDMWNFIYYLQPKKKSDTKENEKARRYCA